MIAILGSGCAQKGYVKKGNIIQINSSSPLIEQAQAINDGQYSVEFKKLDKNETPLIDDVPVGTIIAHFGPWQFSDKWQICMGQEIRDPDSPLYGRKVPDLNGAHAPFQATYIAGTLDSRTYNKKFGNNILPGSGTHSHGGRTGRGGGRSYGDADDERRHASSDHDHTISADGNHDHGGDNRPNTFGLIYLIRVK